MVQHAYAEAQNSLFLRICGAILLTLLGIFVLMYPGNPLHDAAGDYLEQATDGAIRGFLSLSGLKVGLAMIEGSEIGLNLGVKASLQVGDVVQSAYDYVDVAWRAMLAASVVLLASQHLLDAADMLDHACLVLAVMCILLRLGVHALPHAGLKTRRVLTDAAAFLVVLSLVLYAVIPLSFLGGGVLSERIVAPSRDAAQSGLQALGDELFPDASVSADMSTVERIKNATARVQDVAMHLHDRSVELVEWVVRLIAGYVFDTIIFPAAVFFLLFYLTKLCMRYVFGLRQSRNFREDLGIVLAEQDARLARKDR